MFPKYHFMKSLLIALLAGIFILMACNNRHDYEIKSKDKYENGKLSIEDIEKKSPERFLSVKGSNKKNLLGQTVIKGTIFNNAKIVYYKDVELKLFFYSKTGTLLEEDHDTIYESISPGGSASFKSKYFAPKGTDSIAIKVLTAKF
jgi:uncharacterized lipoprotein NlpE involved in copper resistance